MIWYMPKLNCLFYVLCSFHIKTSLCIHFPNVFFVIFHNLGVLMFIYYTYKSLLLQS